MKSRKIGQDGISIVQVLVAFSIMTGLALALTKLTQTQLKSQKTVDIEAEVQELENKMRFLLTDKDACYATFGNAKKGQSILFIKMDMDDEREKPLMEVGKRFLNTQAWIKSMKLLTHIEERDKYKLKQQYRTSDGKGLAYLRVEMIKGDPALPDNKQDFFGAKQVAKIFPFYAEFKVSATGLALGSGQLAQDNCKKRLKDAYNIPLTVSQAGNPINPDSSMPNLFTAECWAFGEDKRIASCLTPAEAGF